MVRNRRFPSYELNGCVLIRMAVVLVFVFGLSTVHAVEITGSVRTERTL